MLITQLPSEQLYVGLFCFVLFATNDSVKFGMIGNLWPLRCSCYQRLISSNPAGVEEEAGDASGADCET